MNEILLIDPLRSIDILAQTLVCCSYYYNPCFRLEFGDELAPRAVQPRGALALGSPDETILPLLYGTRTVLYYSGTVQYSTVLDVQRRKITNPENCKEDIRYRQEGYRTGTAKILYVRKLYPYGTNTLHWARAVPVRVLVLAVWDGSGRVDMKLAASSIELRSWGSPSGHPQPRSKLKICAWHSLGTTCILYLCQTLLMRAVGKSIRR